MASSSVLVAGSGAWGTALATVLARNGVRVLLWGRDHAHIQELKTARINQRYLPQVKLSPLIFPTSDLEQSVRKCQNIIFALPSAALESFIRQVRAQTSQKVRLCLACKGIKISDTPELNHQIVYRLLPAEQATVAVLSGPSFATETARQQPTAVSLASRDQETADFFTAQLHQVRFRVYTSSDLIGVQVAGAMKNVIAIAVGIADGLGFGINTQAALITRGMAEVVRYGTALGGSLGTFLGLSGMGDLILTCTSNQSRNRSFGVTLVKKQSISNAANHQNSTIEGEKTAIAVAKNARQLGIDMPITEQIAAVLTCSLTPKEALENLLNREPKKE